MSSNSMSEFQDDFLLDVSDSKFLMQTIAPHNAFGGSSRSLTSEKLCLVHDKPDCLKNEIKPEVSAMIAVWKSTNIICCQELDRQGLSGDHQIDSMRVFEPYRCCTTSQPPKRFYRTFWRSIARRALQQAVDQCPWYQAFRLIDTCDIRCDKDSASFNYLKGLIFFPREKNEDR